MKILLNGRVEDNSIYVSEALNFGYSLFETVKVESGKLLFLKEHIERLNKSLDILGLRERVDFVNIEKDANRLLEINSIYEGALKILVAKSQDELIYILSNRMNSYSEDIYRRGFKLKLSKVFRNESSIITKVKSANYLENILERKNAMKVGWDDCLFLNSKERIAETSIANIFFVKEKNIYTPDIEEGILDGILRNIIIEIAKNNGIKVYEGKYSLEELNQADEVFLTNSLMGIMPVSDINGIKFNLENNKMTEELMSRYKKMNKGE